MVAKLLIFLRIRLVLEFLLSAGIYLMLFYSIFTVYYTSPLIRDAQLIPLNTSPLATHLIFIVSDGMRADKLFGGSMENAPFFKSILLDRGVWGLSHTRVPTESRPGHVAMLGGFYEDVSAVTKGWKANPVEFDSILNRSLRVWAFGNQDVVEPFESISSGHVQIQSTPKELRDMARADLNDADRWVIGQFMNVLKDLKAGFFANFTPTKADIQALRRGHVAFLHLDTADLAGHAFKPGSLAYGDMIRHLDELIAGFVREVERVSTGLPVKVAFILTSDHGMTDWGSHGSGSLHETVTPLLAWGSGLANPEVLTDVAAVPDISFDRYGLPIHNHNRIRREISQADLCPLMASLLGIPIPVNSVGRIPLAFLNTDDATKVKLLKANCLQLIVQVKAKLKEQRASHLLLFFKEFAILKESDIENLLVRADQLNITSKYKDAIVEYERLADLSLKALSYYHKYDRRFLGVCIGTTFLLWSLLIISLVMGSTVHSSDQTSGTGQRFTIWILRSLLVLMLLFTVGLSYSWPLSHTVYQIVPLLLALHLLCSPLHHGNCRYWCSRLMHTIADSKQSWTDPQFLRLLFLSFFSLILVELMIWGFHFRPLLALACVLLALWPLLDKSFGFEHSILRLYWSSCCLVMAVFPLLPVIGSAFYPVLGCISGLFVVPVNLYCLRHLVPSSSNLPSISSASSNTTCLRLGYWLSCLLSVASICVGIVHSTLGSSTVVRLLIHSFSWLLLVFLPLSVLIWSPSTMGIRLLSWINVFLIPFVLLSTGYEVIFLAVFVTLGFLWIQLETPLSCTDRLWAIRTSTSKTDIPGHSAYMSFKDFRQSLFFIFLLTISFFGTGNIASVNSFDPRSTYCFLTSLNPITMAFFLMVKILCPMLCLSVIYAAVQGISCVDQSCLQFPNTTRTVAIQTGLVSVMSNFIAVHFFAWLRDEGSWLEIGNSISHYVIAMGIGFAAFLFAHLGRHLLTAPRCGPVGSYSNNS